MIQRATLKAYESIWMNLNLASTYTMWILLILLLKMYITQVIVNYLNLVQQTPQSASPSVHIPTLEIVRCHQMQLISILSNLAPPSNEDKSHQLEGDTIITYY